MVQSELILIFQDCISLWKFQKEVEKELKDFFSDQTVMSTVFTLNLFGRGQQQLLHCLLSIKSP